MVYRVNVVNGVSDNLRRDEREQFFYRDEMSWFELF
jgi:hypothetical protein